MVTLRSVFAFNVSDEIRDLRNQEAILSSEYNTLKNVEKNCPTCGQDIPNADSMIESCAIKVQELGKTRKQIDELVKQQTKFDLVSQLDFVPEDQDTLLQMKSDLEKEVYINQYDMVKDVVEPKAVDVDSTKTLLTESEKLLANVKNLIREQEEAQKIIDEVKGPRDKDRAELKKLDDLVKYIDTYRKEFSQNIIPLIIRNAKTIFHVLTENKFSDMQIDKD